MTAPALHELAESAYCVLAWIDRSVDTGRLAAERLERALAGVKVKEEESECEQDAWDELQRWQLHPRKRLKLTLGVGRFVVTLYTTDAYYNTKEHECAGPTRLDALRSAVAWIKKEDPNA